MGVQASQRGPADQQGPEGPEADAEGDVPAPSALSPPLEPPARLLVPVARPAPGNRRVLLLLERRALPAQPEAEARLAGVQANHQAPSLVRPTQGFAAAAERADTLAAVRVLVVTNITPDEAAPWRGRFVRDQVDAIRKAGIDVELFSFPVGRSQYPRATVAIRRLLRRERYDLVHAHYGLAGWCAALAGARPLVVSFHGTDVRHPVTGLLSRRLVGRLDLIAAASRALFSSEGGRPALPRRAGRSAILPTGANLDRFRPTSRAEARKRIGLAP